MMAMSYEVQAPKLNTRFHARLLQVSYNSMSCFLGSITVSRRDTDSTNSRLLFLSPPLHRWFHLSVIGS